MENNEVTGTFMERGVRLLCFRRGAFLFESSSASFVTNRPDQYWSVPARVSSIVILGSLCLLAPSISRPQSSQDSSQKAKPEEGLVQTEATKPVPIKVDDAYRIGIGDQLQISVWHEHDLSLQVAVRPDGDITMPLLNDIYVVGKTPKELSALITEKLKPFVNEPQVTVSVSSIQSRKVYLIGQVARQGVFALNDKKTVLDLITEAGGLGPFAKSKSIYVLRVVDGKEVHIPFHYKKVVEGREKDVNLLPGDKVVVP
jgi:polysaccharide export outer membrane protein